MSDYGGSTTPKNERDRWQTPVEIFNALDLEEEAILVRNMELRKNNYHPNHGRNKNEI